MNVITRQIWVTQRLRIQPIDVVYGSQVSIALQLMDYDIPTNAIAKAYARGKNTTTTYVSTCTISGDTVSFTPPDGFFIPGLNLLQIEINGAIIHFSINVNCEGRISELGDTAPPEKVRPLVERAVMAAAEAEAASNDASKSATEAAGSANAAKSSETNAKASETAAETAAGNAETAAAGANAALEQVPESAAETVRPYTERAETAATKAEQALQTIQTDYQGVGELQERLKSGKLEDSELHLGWYLDADSKLHPKERSIDMGSQSITGLPTPTADTDAANKGYVDAGIAGVNTYAAGLRVRNLLDNSDFTHPVVQAGAGGKHGNQAYAADRWILDSGSVETGVGLTLNGTIRQKLEYPPAGAVSAFVGMVSGEAAISYAGGEVTITSAGGILKWAALYEGAYTTETRPPYVSNRYGVELAECRRYYMEFHQIWLPGFASDDIIRTTIHLPTAMRAVPSVVTGKLSWAMGAVDGYYQGNGTEPVAIRGGNKNTVELQVTVGTAVISSLASRMCLVNFNDLILCADL